MLDCLRYIISIVLCLIKMVKWETAATHLFTVVSKSCHDLLYCLEARMLLVLQAIYFLDVFTVLFHHTEDSAYFLANWRAKDDYKWFVFG